MRFSLLPSPITDCVYPSPLNAGLVAKPFESQMKPESASLSERPDVLIVAAPRQAKLQALVFVRDAQAIADWRPPIGQRQRVLVLAGEVDDGRSENRPIASEFHAAGDPQLFLVAEILDGRVDVAVEPQVADLSIGLL